MTSKFGLTMSLIGSAAVAGSALAAPVVEDGRRFTVSMDGHQECNSSGTCNVGDPDGTGTATIVVNLGQRRICYELTVSNIVLPASAAHIHVGPAGTAPAGNIVQGLVAPNAQGTSSACIDNVSRDLLRAIVSNPANYYVNVHNSVYPGGAVRGQLSHAPR